LGSYVDLLNARLREGKRQIIVKRLALVIEKAKQRLRFYLLRWRIGAIARAREVKQKDERLQLKYNDPLSSMRIGILHLSNVAASFKNKAITLNPIASSLRSALTHWRIQTATPSKLLFSPYHQTSLYSALSSLTKTLSRHREQALRSCFADLRLHTDHLKKHSLAHFLLKDSTTSATAATPSG
jgi:hypothetical protein